MSLPHLDNGNPYLVADLTGSSINQLSFAREALGRIAEHECRFVHHQVNGTRGNGTTGSVYVARHEVQGDATPSRSAGFEPDTCPVCLAKQAIEILELANG